MTIRKTLMRAFLLVALAPAILVGGMAFVKARQALQTEIEQGLATRAATVASELDRLMFERLQNALVWSQLEIMQDLQMQDVDRRLSAFLARLHDGYGGLYRRLEAVDPAGRVIAGSDAARLGRIAPPLPQWQRLSLSGTAFELSLEEGAVRALWLSTPIRSHFGEQVLGELRLALDPGQLQDVVERGAADGRLVMVTDGQGRMVAHSAALPGGLPPLSGAAVRGDSTLATLDGAALGLGDLLLAEATSAPSPTWGGLGWKVRVMQPVDGALAPIHRMMWLTALLALLLLGLAVLLALGTSGSIARPILALTAFTRSYRGAQRLDRLPAVGDGEVGELAAAFVTLMRDIEQSRRQLVQASKLAAVGEMASIIAHEVRTPLGILRSSAQMLQREAGLSTDGRELMGFIESETERLNRLVSTMLDSARPRQPVFAAIDLHGLIRQTLGLLAAQAGKKDIRLSEHLQAVDPVVSGDAEQLTQVLLNLLLNAVQILQAGGSVDVASSDHPAGLQIDIVDNGPGIAPEERERIFEAFFFRREGGVGLGLAVVQQIVLAHGGSIVADAGPEGGARFTLLLPRPSHKDLP